MTAKGALGDYLGALGGSNVQGETQKKLDVLAHEIMLRSCEWGGLLAGMVSEELDEPYAVPEEYARGDYLLVFDPLDGSSNTDVNVSVGTIFSVLRTRGTRRRPTADFLQPGCAQVAAGYAIYGPATMLVLSVGKGTHGFTLDREIGNFILTHPGPARSPRRRASSRSTPATRASGSRRCTATSPNARPARRGRARPRFQHALDRLHGRRGAPHPHARRRLHVPEGHQGTAPGPGGCACSTRRTRSACWWSRRAAAPAPAASA